MSRKAVFGAGGAVLLLGVGWWFYHLLVPRTLADDARAVLSDTWSPNGGDLYGYVYPGETKALGWTPQKLQTFLETLVRPKYGRAGNFSVQGARVNMGLGGPVQGVCQAYITLPGGHKAGIEGVVDQTDNGPRTSAIDMLIHSWFVEFHINHPDAPWTADSALQGELEGYDHDKAQLVAIGIPGIVYRNKPDELVTWERWEANGRDMLARELGDRQAGAVAK